MNVYNREDIKESTLFYNEEDIILEKYKHLQTPEYIYAKSLLTDWYNSASLLRFAKALTL